MVPVAHLRAPIAREYLPTSLPSSKVLDDIQKAFDKPLTIKSLPWLPTRGIELWQFAPLDDKLFVAGLLAERLVLQLLGPTRIIRCACGQRPLERQANRLRPL